MAIYNRHCDHLRKLVGMGSQYSRAQAVEESATGLDEQRPLGCLLDCALPTIDALDSRNDVYARGEPLIYQRSRHSNGFFRAAAVAENDNFVGHENFSPGMLDS
jgi:hypothetical protein